MMAEVEAARPLTYWAAHLEESGDPRFTLASSIAKHYAMEAAPRTSRNANRYAEDGGLRYLKLTIDGPKSEGSPPPDPQ
jgi:alkylation response protein AidB-like acyl-CoA dehydrogenase